MSMKQTMFNNNKPKTPRSPTSPTIRQLLQAERTPNYLSSRHLSSPKQQDEDQFDFQSNKKLSVIAKVKEKAKKWKQSLARKKPGQDGDPTPNWGVAYDDYDDDPRRLGTPTKVYAFRRSSTTYKERMRSSSYKEGLRSTSYKEGMKSRSYREGLRSSSYKEGMRERSILMSGLSITEKHVLSYSIDRGYSEDCERVTPKEDLSPSERLRSDGTEIRGLMPIQRAVSDPKGLVYRDPSPEIKITPLEDDEDEISPIQEPNVNHPASPPKSSKEGNAEAQDAKLTPLASPRSVENDAEVSPLASPRSVEKDATNDLNPSYLKLIVEEVGKAPNPSPEEGAFAQERQEIDSPIQIKNLADAVIEKLALASSSEEQDMPFPKALTVITPRKEALVSTVVDDHDQDYRKRDMGASVKEYIKNKLEPGEDERALSQVISEAISPRRTPGDKGVMEKVKEAVTLLLLAEQKQLEQEVKQLQQQQQQQLQQKQQQQLQQIHEQQQELKRPASMRHPSLSQIPVSTYPYEEELNVEEESHGRILQAN